MAWSVTHQTSRRSWFWLGDVYGRHIPKGSVVESVYSEGGEVLIPLFASKVQENHPPLREYVWEEGNLPEIGTEKFAWEYLLFHSRLGCDRSMHFPKFQSPLQQHIRRCRRWWRASY
jgi:hypothetical protein